MATINEIMASAQAAAANIVPVTANTSTGVAVSAPSRNFDLDDVTSDSLSVDKWLKVNHYGMTLGGAEGILFKKIIVAIDLTEVVAFKSVKYGPEGKVKYFKTRNGHISTDGASWDAIIEQGTRVTGKTKEEMEFTCVDLPMEVVEDFYVKDAEGKSVLIAEAGTLLGHTTSATNFKYFKSFLRDVAKKGLKNQTVVVELVHDPRSKEGGHKWGNIEFNLLDATDVAQAA